VRIALPTSQRTELWPKGVSSWTSQKGRIESGLLQLLNHALALSFPRCGTAIGKYVGGWCCAHLPGDLFFVCEVAHSYLGE